MPRKLLTTSKNQPCEVDLTWMPPEQRQRLQEITNALKKNDFIGVSWLVMKSKLVAEAKGIFDTHSARTETWSGWCEENDMDRPLSYHLISIWERFSTAGELLGNFSPTAIRWLGQCGSDQPAKHAIVLAGDGEFISLTTAKQIVTNWTNSGTKAMDQAEEEEEEETDEHVPDPKKTTATSVTVERIGLVSKPAPTPSTPARQPAAPAKQPTQAPELNPVNQIIRAKEKITQLMRILDEEDLKPTLGQRWNTGLVNLCEQLLKSLGDAEKNVYRQLEKQQQQRKGS